MGIVYRDRTEEQRERHKGAEKRLLQVTSFRRRIGMLLPASMCSCFASTTKKQLARASAVMPPEPCHGSALTSGTTPRHSTLAGRKWASPGFSGSAWGG